MKITRSYSIYYTDVDRLILDRVAIALEEIQGKLDLCFWERHYAGGPHLRLRLRGEQANLDLICPILIEKVQSFISSHPSIPLSTYSPAAAERLLRMEGETAGSDELIYRVNEIHQRNYERSAQTLASDEARVLLETFLSDALPLALAIMRSPRSRIEQLLRLYFLHALLLCNDLPKGSVSFKSHWESFAAAHFPSQQVIERVRAAYKKNRSKIEELMTEVSDLYAKGDLESDFILGGWNTLFAKYRAWALRAIEAGTPITIQMNTVEEVRTAQERLERTMVETSPFLQALYGDERFMALFQFEKTLLWPRVLTNLLYQLLALVGLKTLDKITLCYYSHHAVEEHFGCDLTDIINQTVATVIERHGWRLTQEVSVG